MAETAKAVDQVAAKDRQLPLSAKYAVVARTNAIFKDNALDVQLINFMRAERISRKDDSWKVMHFEIYEDENKETRFKSRVVKDDLNFIQAMAHLAAFENANNVSDTSRVIELDPVKTPFLKKDFFEVEHFVGVAEREGVVFDRSGTPHVKNDGRVVSEGNFLVKDLVRADKAEEVSRLDSADGVNILEKGVLAEMFNGVSAKGDYNAALIGFNALGFMDHVAHAVQEYSFYMKAYLGKTIDVEGMISGKDNISKSEEKQIRDFFAQLRAMDKGQQIENALRNLSVAEDYLDKIEKIGVYAGPFKAFVAQCEVATHVIQGQIAMEALKNSRNDNTEVLRLVENNTSAAEAKYRQMGATDGEIKTLKAAILKGGKPELPAIVDDFVARYSRRRDGIDAKLKEAQKRGADAASVIAADPNAPGTVLVKSPAGPTP